MHYSDWLFLLLKISALLIFFAVTLMLGKKGKKKRSTATKTVINTATLITPSTPKLSLSFQSVRNLRFQWRDVDGASHYQLLERLDHQSDVKLAGSYIPSGKESMVLTTPLFNRINAQYALRAFNEQGFTDSAFIAVATELEDTLDYLKASKIDSYEYFGFVIKLNEAKNMLALAEDDFSSAYPKKHGKTASTYTGAAFIFSRADAGQWKQKAYVNVLANADFCDDEDRNFIDHHSPSHLPEKETNNIKKATTSEPEAEICFLSSSEILVNQTN